MVEIKVNLLRLKTAIFIINQLEKGTGHARPYATSEFINHSRGELFRQTNSLYSELMQIEDAMILLIKNTKNALTNAGVAFESADTHLSELNRNLGAVREIIDNGQ